jgi:hypothetical protein
VSDDTQPQRVVRPQAPEFPIRLVSRPRTLHIFGVSEQERDSLSEPSGSLHLTLFGAAVGAFLTLLVTVATLDMGDRAFATFIALTVVSGVFSLYFGARGVIDHRRARKLVARLKAGPGWPE